MRKVLLPILAAAMSFAAGSALAAGDAAAGARIFKSKCAVCHTAEPGKNRVGPSLHGVVGRHAGTVEKFKYSDSVKAAKIVWSEAEIAAYLENPKAFLPGNKMIFAGLSSAADRDDIVAYLKSLK